MNEFEQQRHWPKPGGPDKKFCANPSCPSHRKEIKFGSVCNECGHLPKER